MDALTLTQISVMDEVIPDLRCLGFALEQADRACCKLGVMVSDAWALFDVAIEEGRSAEVKNELAEVAAFAERRLSLAKRERDEIKATILAVQS
jgi:hypothetical protein